MEGIWAPHMEGNQPSLKNHQCSRKIMWKNNIQATDIEQPIITREPSVSRAHDMEGIWEPHMEDNQPSRKTISA